MKRLFAAAGLAVLLACGGGGGGSAPTPPPAPPQPHPPAITNVVYLNPMTVVEGSGGGFAPMNFTFQYADSGADMDMVVLEQLFATGGIAKSLAYPLTGTVGTTYGTVTMTMTVSTTPAGQHNFRFHATDKAGNRSNDLPGTFIITPAPAPAPIAGATAWEPQAVQGFRETQ